MNNVIIEFVTKLLFQVLIGLILGFCWNYGLADLGVPKLGILNAILLWFGVVIAFSRLSYIALTVHDNMQYMSSTRTQKLSVNRKKTDEEKN